MNLFKTAHLNVSWGSVLVGKRHHINSTGLSYNVRFLAHICYCDLAAAFVHFVKNVGSSSLPTPSPPPPTSIRPNSSADCSSRTKRGGCSKRIFSLFFKPLLYSVWVLYIELLTAPDCRSVRVSEVSFAVIFVSDPVHLVHEKKSSWKLPVLVLTCPTVGCCVVLSLAVHEYMYFFPSSISRAKLDACERSRTRCRCLSW